MNTTMEPKDQIPKIQWKTFFSTEGRINRNRFFSILLLGGLTAYFIYILLNLINVFFLSWSWSVLHILGALIFIPVGLALILLGIALFVASYFLIVRRAHDINIPTIPATFFWLFSIFPLNILLYAPFLHLWLLPYVSFFLLILLAAMKGTSGGNRFGPDSLHKENITDFLRSVDLLYERTLILSGKIGPVFALIVVMAIFGSQKPELFFSMENLGSVAGQTAVIAVAAIGMTFVIISAGIDLSVGSLVALAGIFSTQTMAYLYGGGSGFAEASGGYPALLCIMAGIFIGLLTGLAAGLFNGSTITYGKLPPFIVTLGMLEILRGSALHFAGGLPVTGLPEEFAVIGNQNLELFGMNTHIPYSMFILIPLAILGGFILKYTVFGTHVYAIGSNEQTAKLCGVNVNRTKIMVYVIGGVTAAVAGLIQASRLRSGQPSTGVGLELDIIAAVVVGGGSLMGGEGTILGSIVGAFIIRLLRNGCVLLDITPFVQRIIIGLIIIAAVFVDQLRRRLLAAKAQSNR
ncbi:DUF805 domain-containing protein [bacterium]|nr:DUF805 domain-containing protein [bacterium]